MTTLRDALHRWAVVGYLMVNLSASALRSFRRAQRRRRMWRRVGAGW